MPIGNTLIRVLNRPVTRGLLEKIIYARYIQKGQKIERVKYHDEFDAWEFRVEGTSYLSSGPGWVYTNAYLLDQLKRLSGFDYMPQNGDVVVDVGAGVGEETIIFSSLVGVTGKVYSVEAHPKTFRALSYLVLSNSLKNVIASNLALSDKSGTVKIEDTNNSLGNSILQVTNSNVFTIPAETFDEFVERHNIQRIDFLKMNVEGAEQLIIKGMDKNIQYIKHLSISCHDFRYHQGESIFFKTKELVTQFLLKHNFKIRTQRSTNAMLDDYMYATNPNI